MTTRDDALLKRLVARFDGPYVAERQDEELQIFEDPLLGQEPTNLRDLNIQNSGARRLCATFMGNDFIGERVGGTLEISIIGAEFASIATRDHAGALREMNRRNHQRAR